VITVGDNLYGLQRPQDYKKKFEIPYRPLLADGVKFYAALGNHDSREQVNYKLFNMDSKFYYTLAFPEQSVRFFMLDTTYLSPEQLDWLKKELEGSNENWKIAVFHHPLYSSGKLHGSDLKLREALEALFVANNVSVVLNGHDHDYERIKPQRGIVYFVTGSGGKLRSGGLRTDTGITDKGYDSGHAFLALEVSGDHMYFNAITTDGRVVDSGIIERRMPRHTAAGK
jgi:3',5'-cyclic AMP phosphodiesterase CpdA